MKKPKNIQKKIENKLKQKKPKKYSLNLYVAGLSPRSQKAIENIRQICNKYLSDRYELKVHDIYKTPIIAKEGQIMAAPTLIKTLPLPIRRFVGDMSNLEKILVGLDLRLSDPEV